jgi:hypothetical protein
MPNPGSTSHPVFESKAKLLVVIDTEEDFDWSGEFSRDNTAVGSMRSIGRMQRVFEEYCITPVYVIDYPVASQSGGYEPLAEIHARRACVVGAHLHPWVNPPFEEEVNRFNSFPGNLGRSLEAAKLKVLTDTIAERFGRPRVYKAGRYGIGPHTAAILEEQGYEVDLSVCPHMDYSSEGGPDFSANSVWPSKMGGRLLELPLTVGYAGALRRWGPRLHNLATKKPLLSLHMPGILARSGFLNKIWLSPEGYLAEELIALTKAFYRSGLRVFSFAFHSPSLEPGHTPYVRSQADLERFFITCRRFFDFFFGELRGIATTPLELKAHFANNHS